MIYDDNGFDSLDEVSSNTSNTSNTSDKYIREDDDSIQSFKWKSRLLVSIFCSHLF